LALLRTGIAPQLGQTRSRSLSKTVGLEAITKPSGSFRSDLPALDRHLG
jgi:hypothetical protein